MSSIILLTDTPEDEQDKITWNLYKQAHKLSYEWVKQNLEVVEAEIEMIKLKQSNLSADQRRALAYIYSQIKRELNDGTPEKE